ncbi:hypothetical protein SLEP1_g40561 [Rubroshorea leprosula]|uniref:Uncharacterized protein n=1 Tax=Rubroshorea leprosula TaxID=152421 RepID=A0AAV5L433_9ROSI|nr:hypothetical protein SLEP1_g40561 [Rubroshorea leprosula]
MNDIISYAGNVELYVDHDINIPEIVEGPLLLTRDVSKDEGDNSGSDVCVHGDEGNLGCEKSSDVDSGSDDVSVIDWETSSDDSAWSLGSDKTDDENEQEDDHVEERVVTQEQPSVQQQQVRRGDPIDSTQQLPISDDSGSSTDEEDRESDYADSDDLGAWEFHWNSDDKDDIFVQPDHVIS